MDTIAGTVSRIVGPVVEVNTTESLQMLELIRVGENRLVGEVMRINGKVATMQIYEDTTGIKPGDSVYGTGQPLSVELGPGLIGTIYDGIQRPLEVLRNKSGAFIQRGVIAPCLDRTKKWGFSPKVKKGDRIEGGAILGNVPENKRIIHKILLPPNISGIVTSIAKEGLYTVDHVIANVESNGTEHSITMLQHWPVRIARPKKHNHDLTLPLITGQRVIDTLFPIPKGGTVAVPGGFGTGKTMVQQAIAKWCDADIIIYIGCGERGNEITDVLSEFPKLIDPRTNRPLMERTIIIANTSNMPVAAREASIYTGVTLAEYYRDMGYHVALMADSTSRWAEALRELSGRFEQMPADEGFPAYLPTRLASFYERAGYVTNLADTEGSVTIIGSVSPPGGDFSEPVTQHTRRFVRAFWALDKQLASARHYPSISWLNSYSDYVDGLAGWWESNVDVQWRELRHEIMSLLQKESKLQQVVKLVGPDVLPDTQRLILEVCTLFKNGFLQQNAFDKIDMFSVVKKQLKMLRIITQFYRTALHMIKHGSTLVRIKGLPVFRQISTMKSTIPNDKLDDLDTIYNQLMQGYKEPGTLT